MFLTVSWLLSAPFVARAASPLAAANAYTLDNGLVVVIVPMSTAPGTAVWQLWMDVGSGDEVIAGRTGFAHFFEHLMFHGSEAIPASERERELLDLGVEENAWTWLDDTVYNAILPAASLERYAELEADRFQALALTPEGVRREAGAVYGEFRKERSDPGSALYDGVQAAAFGVHPYGHSTLGLKADIEAMPNAHAAAVAFHHQYYRPGNATLILTGDVDVEASLALVERTFGAWEGGTDPRPPIPIEPDQVAPRQVVVSWPAPTAPILDFAWKIPPNSPTNFEAQAALELASMLLLAPTGPLNERLVREEGIAFRVGGGRSATRDPGVFRITVALRELDGLERAEAIVREEVAALAAAADPARVRLAQRHFLAQRQLQSDDPVEVAYLHGGALFPGSGVGTTEAIAAFEAAMASEVDIAAAVAAHLRDERLTLGVLRPEGDP